MQNESKLWEQIQIHHKWANHFLHFFGNYLEYDNETDVNRPWVEKSKRIVERLFMNEQTEYREAEEDVDLDYSQRMVEERFWLSF